MATVRNSLLLLSILGGNLNDYYNDYPKYNKYDRQNIGNREYDFVIVGAGSAGSSLAYKLSQITSWNILLLEAGGKPTILADVPGAAAAMYTTDNNYGYLMEKQNNIGLGLKRQRMGIPRGKGLGGSSLIDYMMYTRPNRYDLDKWAEKDNPGWAYKDILPYFKKTEDSQIEYYNTKYRSTNGPLNVGFIPYRTTATLKYLEATYDYGMEIVEDYNAENQIGSGFLQVTLKNGTRCHAEKAFLKRAIKRNNLKIISNAKVIRILIDQDSKVAEGVIYHKDNKYYEVFVKKEVILSAGAINSPQLLMLSGVGPREDLDKLEIPVIKNLPVGKSMYDHFAYLGLFFKLNETLRNDKFNSFTVTSSFNEGRGPLTMPAMMFEATSFINTNVTSENSKSPDVELLFGSTSLNTNQGNLLKTAYRITDKIYDEVWKPLQNTNTFTIVPILYHPKSKGYLKLRTKNPFDSPKIYGNYLSDSNNVDVKTLIAGIRVAQKIAKSPILLRYGSKQIFTKIPGCENFEKDSDEYYECGLRHIGTTFHSQVATCRMGPKEDDKAVVNNKLMVRGIKNLRVVDVSVVPLSMAGHLNSLAVAMGYKGADLIKKHWNGNDDDSYYSPNLPYFGVRYNNRGTKGSSSEEIDHSNIEDHTYRSNRHSHSDEEQNRSSEER